MYAFMIIMSIHKGHTMTIFAKRALLEAGWVENTRLDISKGHIVGIHCDAMPEPGDVCVDTLLPALANLHSHSFQRAMAGMTEFRAKGRESFWTWRDLMYRFLEHLTPEHVTAFAALTFMEMQKAGYASVGEFHYVHHQTGGQAYDDPAELSHSIFEAANQTGIGLTHLPVLYTYGGADGQGLSGGQLRFGNSVEAFNDLVSRCQTAAKTASADTQVGIAPHSLRATSPADLRRLLAVHSTGPVHIHIAEQQKEIAEISTHLGARPVEWLLANTEVDARWCLIHATHMTPQETVDMARSGAVAGLCPITEANLGDGAFNGPQYIAAGGAFGVGSDSNINISLTEELRMLEYSQRLRDMERNVLVPGEGSVGAFLYKGAAQGGAQALGRNAGRINVGALADLVAIDAADVSLCALSEENLLDGLVFAANDRVVSDVWSAGRHQVQDGKHIAEAQIKAAYRVQIADVVARING